MNYSAVKYWKSSMGLKMSCEIYSAKFMLEYILFWKEFSNLAYKYFLNIFENNLKNDYKYTNEFKLKISILNGFVPRVFDKVKGEHKTFRDSPQCSTLSSRSKSKLI